MTIFISLFLALLASVAIGLIAARSGIWSHGPLGRRFVASDDQRLAAESAPVGWHPVDRGLPGPAHRGTYAH